MSPILQQALGAAVLPFVAGAAAALCARGEPERRGAVAAPAALAAAYLSTHLWTQGVPAYPYVGVVQGLAYLAVAALVVGLAAARWRAVATPAVALLAAGSVWVLFAFHREAHWAGAEAYLWPAGLALAAGLAAAAWGAGSSTRGPLLTGGLLAAVAACLATSLGLSGSASLAQLAGGLAAGAGALALVGWLRGPLVLGRGVAAVAVTSFGALLLAGTWVGELGPLPACLLGAAFVGAAPGATARLAGKRGAAATVVVLAVTAAVLAVGLVYLERPEPNPYGY